MILVIDSGTTNTKAFLFDTSGKPVCSASCSTKTIYSGPGRVEQNAGDWWLSAVNAVKKLDKKQGAKIDAIVTSTQGGTFVLLDQELEPLQSGITWLDNRAESEAGKLNRRYGKTFYLKTGYVLRGWCPPAVISWFKKNEPDIHRKTARISFVADYLNYKMTGRFFIDQTAAGMTSFFNLNSGAWDNDLLDIAGIKSNFLPEIVLAGKSGGLLNKRAARALDLPEGIPVISGGHDQYCASLGAGAVNPGDCLLSCGTAWVLLVLTRKLVFKPGSNWAPGRHFRTGTFGLMGSISNGGIVLDWLKRNLRLQTSLVNYPSERDSRVQVRTGFSEGRGSVENLSLAVGAEDIYYAALKDLARQVSIYLGQLKDAVKLNQLFLVGGGAKEPLLLSIIALNTELEVTAPDINESASRGAALLAIRYLETK